MPTKFRNVSGLAVSLSNGAVWLFDCGEGTQHQLQRAEGVSQGRIERIFITHLHGDHCYGLPGLLCSVGMLWQPPTVSQRKSDEGEVEASAVFYPLNERSECLEIVGPAPLGMMLRTALRCSDAWLPFRYHVTEVVCSDQEVPDVPADALHPCESPPTRVKLDEQSCVGLGVINGCSIRAARLSHRVPSLGYVITEPDAPGALDVVAATALGVPRGPLLAQLKAGQPVTTPNGTVVQPAQVVGLPMPGRKLVVLGDTCDSTNIAPLATNADWLIHECTFDDDTAHLAVPRGHSTAAMAGAFAESIGAQCLLLTHFSARFLPRSKDAEGVQRLENQARRSAPRVRTVHAVEDFESVSLARKR